MPVQTSSRAAVAVDRAAALALVALYVWFAVWATYNRREYFDTVAYALPGANLVARGSLDIAQLGSQYGFDRFWLLNAPILVVGEVPFFLLAGVGRIQGLAGIVALAVFNLIVFAWSVRRGLGLRSAVPAVLIAFAFLGIRAMPTSDLYNQRYAIAAFGCLALAFTPLRRGDGSDSVPWWRWLSAGVLPLIHPLLLPASIVFAIYAVRQKPVSMGGVLTLGACVLGWVAWYGRVTALTTQFLPHARFGRFRSAGSFGGAMDAAASFLFAIPTRTLTIAIAAAGIAIVAAALARPSVRTRLAAVMPAALVVAFVVAVDAWRGFQYADYFLIGAAPALLAAVPVRARRLAIVALVAIGCANVAIASRIDRQRPDWTTTRETRDFVTAHTAPGDRIVLGPPFVLIAATGVAGRATPRIVPQPYFLDTFDASAFVRDINDRCDVYIGSPQWYYRPVWTQPSVDRGLFDRASIQRLDFRGQEVIVARKDR